MIVKVVSSSLYNSFVKYTKVIMTLCICPPQFYLILLLRCFQKLNLSAGECLHEHSLIMCKGFHEWNFWFTSFLKLLAQTIEWYKSIVSSSFLARTILWS